jgi:CRISPR/Cas system-associated endoribonuclease Cas2
MNDWIIGYDIAHPRRLARIHRAMVDRATPIEYSVFLFHGTERSLQECLATVQRLMDEKADDVRCYPLPARGLQERIGKAALPEGIQWTGLPAGLLSGQ